ALPAAPAPARGGAGGRCGPRPLRRRPRARRPRRPLAHGGRPRTAPRRRDEEAPGRAGRREGAAGAPAGRARAGRRRRRALGRGPRPRGRRRRRARHPPRRGGGVRARGVSGRDCRAKIAAAGTVCYDPPRAARVGVPLNPISRNLGLWLLLLLMGLLLWSVVTKQQPREPEISYSQFMEAVDQGRVAAVVIQGKNVRGHYRTEHGGVGDGFKTIVPDDPDLVRNLKEHRVEIEARPEDSEPWYLLALVNYFPMLLLIGVWIFFMRQMQVGGGKAMSFGKSRAKLLSENQHKVTFG